MVSRGGFSDERSAPVGPGPDGGFPVGTLPAVTDVFARLVDTLADDHDPRAFAASVARATVGGLGVDAVGVMLVDGVDELEVVASTDAVARALAVFEIDHREGPAIDAFRTSSSVVVGDLAADPERWSRFGPCALRGGYGSVSAMPMRVREQCVGVLSLFNRRSGCSASGHLAMAEVFAEVAAVGILSARRVREARVVADQLQRALDSRVVVEQAKGVLAERLGVDVDTAFAVMRRSARSRRRRLADVAAEVLAGDALGDPGGGDVGRRGTVDHDARAGIHEWPHDS